MKSFLKSLPSHRKKEKRSRKSRKSRDNKESGGDQKIKIECARFLDQTGELNLNLDYRGGNVESQCSESNDMMSPLTDEGSFVAGTQIRFPLRNNGKSVQDRKKNDEDDVTDERPPQQSLLLSAALPSDDIVHAPSEIQCPPMSQKVDDNNNNAEETTDFGIDFQQGEIDVNNATEMDPLDGPFREKIDTLDGSVVKSEISNIEDAATSLAATKLHSNNIELLSKIDPANVEDREDNRLSTTIGEDRLEQGNDTTVILCQLIGTKEQQQQDEEISVDETHMSLELLKKPDSIITESIKPASRVPPNELKTSQQHHSPAVSKEHKSAEQREHDQEFTSSSRCSTENANFVFSLADIRQCIEEVEEAKQLSEKDPSVFDVDVDKFHDVLQQFQKYISALGDASSVEGEELGKVQNEEDKVFIIFDRGMSIDHCNVMFIRDVICTISSGIDDQKRSSPSQASQKSSGENQRKLDELATGLDFVFGISGGVEPTTSQCRLGVTISNSPSDNGTKLCFTKRSGSNDVDKPRNDQSSSIPPYLNEISEIFTRFAANEARALRSQLDTTRLAISKLRSNAMSLQAQALKATDHALHAENETKFVREQYEVELCSRQSEYEMHKKSFEKAKEGYKAALGMKQLELDQVTTRYENELKKARDEVLRLRAAQAEQMDKRNIQFSGDDEGVTNGKIRSTSDRYVSSFTRDNTDNPVGKLAARSHPRNLDYKSSNPVDDTDVKRRRSKDSDNSFANGSKTQRTALKSYSVNNFTDKSSSNINLTRGGKSPPAKPNAAVNPYKKQIRAKAEEDDKPTFAYQEVVRKRDERMALPGHDCEECRKFFDALEAAGGHIDRDEIINQCSRHRSRHKPASTPPNYWTMSFMDSQRSG